eukprot:4287487-Prorocentrum_lima.AAC.1
MTSSLVGSEMCIRDSFSVLGTTHESLTQAEDNGTMGADIHVGTPIDPVSYTHLTLPTICSV